MINYYYYYDLEVYKNYFLACFKKHGSNEYITFELNSEVNELDKLRLFLTNFSKSTFLIGFNILHYDNLILNYILQEKKISTLDLKKLSDNIINDRFSLYKKYKYKSKLWVSVDLFLYWSKMLRISKQVSLKSLAVALNHPKIQELPYHPDDLLSLSQMKEVKTYCYNDIEIVVGLTKFLKEKISLRKAYSEKLKNNNIYSYDDIKLGLAVINSKLEEHKLGNIYDYSPDLSIFKTQIEIKSLILDKIQFETPTLQKVLKFFQELKIYPKGDNFNYKFILDNKIYSLGQGGLHSEEEPEIFKEGEFMLKEKDVTSYYPNLLIRNKWCPPQFPYEFVNIYENIYNERAIAKKNGDKLTNETNKLALNGLTGLLKNQYSPVCAPLVNLSITINGQLALLMLIEKAVLNNIKVFAANTDGVVFKIREDQVDLLNQICLDWEKTHNLELEETHYTSFFKRDINNFIALTNDNKIKAKGMFVFNKPLIDSQNFLIIPKAISEYLLNNIPIEQTILNETNIYLFCASFKVAKTYNVIYNRQIQQQLNRFYPSIDGDYLFKKRKGVEKNLEHLLKDSTVTLFNNFEQKEMKDYNINYKFFINKCKETIDQLEFKNTQLNLSV